MKGNKTPWMDGHMDEILTLTQSWKEGEHFKRTNSSHGIMLKGFFFSLNAG